MTWGYIFIETLRHWECRYWCIVTRILRLWDIQALEHIDIGAHTQGTQTLGHTNTGAFTDSMKHRHQETQALGYTNTEAYRYGNTQKVRLINTGIYCHQEIYNIGTYSK